MRVCARALCAAVVIVGSGMRAVAQQPYTWEQIRARFAVVNPTLRAGQLSIEETRAQEITAYLRPNPDFTFTADGVQITPNQGVWKPFAGLVETYGASYLHERRHKRELRLESAQKETRISELQQADLQRTLLFNLRNAFVQTLQAKAVVALTRENLSYYDRVLGISRDQFNAGDISRVDLDRLELQRVQYESDLQSAQVNLRTAKIQLLTLLNDRTAVDQFEIAGPFDFSEQLKPLEQLRSTALATRQDLRAQAEAVDKARTDHRLAVANGSTDPTFSLWYSHNPSFNNPYANNTVGGSVAIPVRMFDRNQGEKLRTDIDVEHQERLRQANEAQVFGDVDSAYTTLRSNVTLLEAYKTKYLQQAVRVRDTVTYAYQHGGSSLVDFLNAQNNYRTVELSYLNLIGSYLTAANQLNLAVGVEVVQ